MEQQWHDFWQSGSIEDYLILKGIIPGSEEKEETNVESDRDRDRNGVISSTFRGL